MSEANSSPSKGHIHAALMLQYAQDAAETDTPWEQWELYNPAQERWVTLRSECQWFRDAEYRRKPRTILINNMEVPAAAREAPTNGTPYWIPHFPGVAHFEGVAGYEWEGSETDRKRMTLGLVHLDIEAAKAHIDALLSFTKRE